MYHYITIHKRSCNKNKFKAVVPPSTMNGNLVDSSECVTTAPTNETQHNTIPSKININSVPRISQSQTENTTTTHLDTTINSQSTTTQTNTVPHKNNFTRVYHETDIYYIMEDYCQPIAESFISSTDVCKYGCDCLVTKQKVLSKGNFLQTTSPTLFMSVPATSKKQIYTS